MINTPEKELILIQPNASNYLARIVFYLIFRNFVPFSLLTLAALTPKEYKIKIINLKTIYLRHSFKKGILVGITCTTGNICEGYKLAKRYKKAGSWVVMGGPHVSALPDEALEYCDSVVIGEAESVWQEVIKDYENNSLKAKYEGQALADFFSPVYEYFANLDPKILIHSGMYTSRGCKYRCDFCARPNQELRFVKIEQVVELVKGMSLAGRNFFIRKPTIYFRDDNIFSDPVQAKKLFADLIPLKIRWKSCSSIDIAFDEEALKLARESGCDELFIGFESIVPGDYEKTSVKKMSSLKDYILAIKNIKKFKIKVLGAFILGLENATHLSCLKLLWFLMRAGFWYAPLTLLTPLPGSVLFEKFKRENRMLTFDWRKYDSLFHIVFKPKNMSRLSLGIWFIFIRIVSLFFSPYILIIVATTIISVIGGRFLAF